METTRTFIVALAMFAGAATLPITAHAATDDIDTGPLSLVEENHAEISRDGKHYVLDSYIALFQRPYHVLVRSASAEPLKKKEAASIAAEYIEPRGCTTPLSRRPDLDRSNKSRTQWLIGIEC